MKKIRFLTPTAGPIRKVVAVLPGPNEPSSRKADMGYWTNEDGNVYWNTLTEGGWKKEHQLGALWGRVCETFGRTVVYEGETITVEITL